MEGIAHQSFIQLPKRIVCLYRNPKNIEKEIEKQEQSKTLTFQSTHGFHSIIVTYITPNGINECVGLDNLGMKTIEGKNIETYITDFVVEEDRKKSCAVLEARFRVV